MAIAVVAAHQLRYGSLGLKESLGEGRGVRRSAFFGELLEVDCHVGAPIDGSDDMAVRLRAHGTRDSDRAGTGRPWREHDTTQECAEAEHADVLAQRVLVRGDGGI